MPNNNDNYELRSEEVQDILTAVPNWTIRSGSALICVLTVLFFHVNKLSIYRFFFTKNKR